MVCAHSWLPHFHAQFMHETFSLHKDGSSANKLWRLHKNWRSSTMSVKVDRTKLLFKLYEVVPWRKNNLWSFLRKIKSCHVLAVGELEITIIFNNNSDIHIFLNGDVLGSWVNLDGTLKWSRGRTVVVQGERHQQSLAIRTEATGANVSKLCVKTLFISQDFHVSSFVAFFVSLGIVISSICKCRSRSLRQNESLRRPAIVSLSTSQEVDNVH